jgi:hypothetical protein
MAGVAVLTAGSDEGIGAIHYYFDVMAATLGRLGNNICYDVVLREIDVESGAPPFRSAPFSSPRAHIFRVVTSVISNIPI